MKTSNYKLQLITPEGKWPFIGNAYINRNGSLSIYLDEGVSLTGGQKLYLRPTRPTADQPQPEAATVE